MKTLMKRATASVTKTLRDMCDDPEMTSSASALSVQLIEDGLLPNHLTDLTPITLYMGYWIGRHLAMNAPLEEAIAELDEIAGATVATITESFDHAHEAIHVSAHEADVAADCPCGTQVKIEAMMLKATLDALALICKPGCAVEVATGIIRMIAAELANGPLPAASN